MSISDLRRRLSAIRLLGDFDAVCRFIDAVHPDERHLVIEEMLSEDERRVYRGEITLFELQEERELVDVRTPEDWRIWLRNARGLFGGDSVRLAAQFPYLPPCGRRTVFFAMTPNERRALRSVQDGIRMRAEAAIQEQRRTITRSVA